MEYRFSDCALNVAKRELTRGGVVVEIEPQVFEVLRHLIEARDRVVTKDELFQTIWRGRAISESVIATRVRAVRRAIGDDARAQRLIATLHRVGYRFVAEVETISPARPAPPPDAPTLPVAPSAPETPVALAQPDCPSIAVLPIAALDPAPAQRLMARGLTHDVTARLARTRWLFVTAGASAERFSLDVSEPAEIARALGVRYLLHGAAMRAGDRLRLVVTLTDANQDREIWAERYDRQIEDLFTVQDEICDLIVSGVEAEMEQIERRRASLRPLASLDAWSAYHRALGLLFRYARAARDEAERCLAHAARLDPNSARICAATSFLHWQRAFLEVSGDREGDVTRALEAAQQSVALDPLDPSAHWALGRAVRLRGEIDESVEELTIATDLNPSYASAHYARGASLMFLSRREEALASVARARRISPYDPLSFAYGALEAELKALDGDSAAAARLARRSAAHPSAHNNIRMIAAWCHELAGETEAARRYVAEVRRRRPDYDRDDFFRACPFRGPDRALIEAALRRLGL